MAMHSKWPGSRVCPIRSFRAHTVGSWNILLLLQIQTDRLPRPRSNTAISLMKFSLTKTVHTGLLRVGHWNCPHWNNWNGYFRMTVKMPRTPRHWRTFYTSNLIQPRAFGIGHFLGSGEGWHFDITALKQLCQHVSYFLVTSRCIELKTFLSLSFIKYNEMVPTPLLFFITWQNSEGLGGGCHVGNVGIWVTKG